jgi:hypothetical protein
MVLSITAMPATCEKSDRAGIDLSALGVADINKKLLGQQVG